MTRSCDALISAKFLLMFFDRKIDISVDEVFFKLGFPVLKDGIARVTHPWRPKSPLQQGVIFVVAYIFKHRENVRF